MAHTIYLGLGSNLGDRVQNLTDAVISLPPAVQVTALSSLYETAPWGYTEQPAFLNQVLAGQTELTPRELLNTIKQIEEKLGRRPTFRYGPREIDIDILFYDDLEVDQPGLAIPHPRLHERAFMLVPLVQIAPAFVHPVLRKKMSELLTEVDLKGIKRITENKG